MLAKVHSGAIVGLTTVPVTIEVDIAAQGLPSFTIVGLPDKVVEESKERVRSAIRNSGAEFPAKRITINLSPADLPKSGPIFDLPLAVGLLIASGQLPPIGKEYMFIGELSLDGSLMHTNGVLPLAMYAKEHSISNIFLPLVDADEAAIVRGVSVYPAQSLIGVYRHFAGIELIEKQKTKTFTQLESPFHTDFDMGDIHGQEHVKRMMEIAAAGSHNIFMKGPPGAGKTLLSRTIPSILPPLTEEEAVEVTKIYSIAGMLPPGDSMMKHRPFRSPHHTTSRIGLIGGGTHPKPGEVTLSHRGVLFLDEFPEFPRHVLEALRQPLEDGVVMISRAAGSISFPSKFMLVAASNPCPCGNYGSDKKQCTCSPVMIDRYKKRISGPILDRIDLHAFVPAVSSGQLLHSTRTIERSSSIRKRVVAARTAQLKRYKGTPILSNAEIPNKNIKDFCALDVQTTALIEQAIDRYALSARSYLRMIKVGRTIADLEGSKDIELRHITEALQYRIINE